MVVVLEGVAWVLVDVLSAPIGPPSMGVGSDDHFVGIKVAAVELFVHAPAGFPENYKIISFRLFSIMCKFWVRSTLPQFC